MSNNEIQFVGKDQIRSTRKRSSKFAPLLDALEKLEVGGQAIEVNYKNDKQVGSMRTAVYQYNSNNDVKIRSAKDSQNGKVYFYR